VDEKINEQRMAAWMTLLQTHATVVAGLEETLMSERNLPLSWHEVLVHLGASPDGRLRMRDLANSVLLSKSGVTRLVDRMADAGLVARGSCLSDRRVVYATITRKGRSALADAMPAFVDGFRKHFSRHLTDAQARVLRGTLQQVLSGNGGVTTPGCPSSYLVTEPSPASEPVAARRPRR
jgi:DNA-binding MarR family transcriptional regulator